MKRINPCVALLAFVASVQILAAAPAVDWLIDSAPFKARVTKSKDGRELELNNGLLRRVI